MQFDGEKFKEYLLYDQLVRRGTEVYYLYWVKEFLDRDGDVTAETWRECLDRFILDLKKQESYQEWQGKQAQKAVTIYFSGFKKGEPATGESVEIEAAPEPEKEPDSSTILLIRFQEKLQRRKCTAKAEQVYLDWVELFLVYVEKSTGKQPDFQSNLKIFVRRFLTYLEVNRDVSPAARKQAFSALELFFQIVFNLELTDTKNFLHLD